jgi:hypothetical protein
MQVIPWFEYGLMEPGDAEVVKKNPEWVLRRADGSALYAMHGANLKTSPLKDLRVWLNPAHPGVRARFIGLMKVNLVSQKRRTCCGAPSSSAASEMVRKALGPFAKRGLAFQSAVDSRLHHLAGAETDDPAGFDLGRLAGLGIAAHAGALGPDLEDAETAELDLFVTLQRFGHEVERAFDQFRAVLPSQAHFFVDRFTQFRARKRRALHGTPPGQTLMAFMTRKRRGVKGFRAGVEA